ncbi:MAG: hypothetical protein A2Z32_03220 [Chloroflexi bacterium RBG_16_69_14]|nr:MAG: hypothetical protein A2Z32_03220 [Chloroflexi bacterium RBG_16_69_14]
MKFEITDAFRADRKRLSETERRLVADVLPAFVAACDRYAEDPSTAWPASLRVKPVEGAPGIFEMTWSFAGPDGRATFEWIRIEDELAVRWRRIGGHAILREP